MFGFKNRKRSPCIEPSILEFLKEDDHDSSSHSATCSGQIEIKQLTVSSNKMNKRVNKDKVTIIAFFE